MFLDDAWMLWILIPIWALGVLAVLWQTFKGLKQPGTTLRFPSLVQMKKIAPSKTIVLRRVFLALRAVALLLLIVAMARPQTGRKHVKVSADGIDIMLAIDTSASMRALDLDADKPIAQRSDRLQVVKRVVQRFIKHRENDQLGMVVFGSDAFTQCPLTLDHGIVATFLERVSIGMAGESTSLGDAVGVALKRLQKSQAKSRVLVLLTDGRQTSGSLNPEKAAEIAKTLGVKIYTIGAGTQDEAPVIEETIFGPKIRMVPSDIDEPTLKNMATSTGGLYFRAEDEKGLSAIYEQIDALETSAIEMHSTMEYDEQFRWFVFLALAVFLLERVAISTRLRKIP